MKIISRFERFQNTKKLNWYLLFGVCIGILFEFISFQMYSGHLPGSNPDCGATNIIWPGFRVSETALCCCVPLNQHYQEFFWIGWMCILISGGIFALSNFISAISFSFKHKNSSFSQNV